mgnify:FL=1
METAKEQYKKILRRCKNALTKVEIETNHQIKHEPEECHEGIYSMAIKSLCYLFDVNFGSDEDLRYGERVVDNVKVFRDGD